MGKICFCIIMALFLLSFYFTRYQITMKNQDAVKQKKKKTTFNLVIGVCYPAYRLVHILLNFVFYNAGADPEFLDRD